MKKILSIFAALALTISASATPLALDVANVSNEKSVNGTSSRETDFHYG